MEERSPPKITKDEGRQRSVVSIVSDYLDSVPSEASIYKKCLGMSVFTLLIVAICILNSDIVKTKEPHILPHELDLSGTWKIKFDDKETYAGPNISDSDWCFINVPDAGKGLVSSTGTNPCPKEMYPTQLMRNKTYWYRKEILIPQGFKLERPSIFLGRIKREGTVYWDGIKIGTALYETAPTILPIDPKLLNPGKHTLAIRATSLDDKYPGIFHAFKRKVVLGEIDESSKAIKFFIRADFVEPVIALVLHLLAFAVLTFFVTRARVGTEKFFWLALYFGSASIYTTSRALITLDTKWFFEEISTIGLALALSGYSATVFIAQNGTAYLLKRSMLLAALISVAIEITAFNLGQRNFLGANLIDKTLTAFSLIFTGVLIVGHILRKVSKENLRYTEWLHILVLVMLSLNYSAGHLFAEQRAFFFHQPLITSVLTVLVIAFAIEDHITKERHLAFFGRFIRKGLKNLLLAHEEKAIAGEKIFRGVRVVIMKIDIIGHTETTFGMPYGFKRIFQDCWFSTIDEVVAKHTFLDKALGDGSLYYFEDKPDYRSCLTTIEAMREIRDIAVQRFDERFKAQVRDMISRYPELVVPSEKFFAVFKQRTGIDFWERKTSVRFALCAGFVDEGLWGMLSQGHYDVEGDLVTLSARLEKKATTEKTVVNDEFIRKLQSEDPNFQAHYELEWNEEVLKGLGSQKYGILREKIKTTIKVA